MTLPKHLREWADEAAESWTKTDGSIYHRYAFEMGIQALWDKLQQEKIIEAHHLAYFGESSTHISTNESEKSTDMVTDEPEKSTYMVKTHMGFFNDEGIQK